MRISVAMGKQGILRARLGDALTMASAVDACDRLRQVSESSERLELDLSSLQDIDTAGVQILLALRKERQAKGHLLRMVQPSQPVQDVMSILGLESLFDEVLTVSKEQTP